ncbi:hypothetical protein GCM10027294_06990 [Marinactinospora endophytica]
MATAEAMMARRVRMDGLLGEDVVTGVEPEREQTYWPAGSVRVQGTGAPSGGRAAWSREASRGRHVGGALGIRFRERSQKRVVAACSAREAAGTSWGRGGLPRERTRPANAEPSCSPRMSARVRSARMNFLLRSRRRYTALM